MGESVKTIKLYEMWNIVDEGWCPYCGTHTSFKGIRNLTDDNEERICLKCGNQFTCDYLGNEDDDIKVPDDFIELPDNYCMICKQSAGFVKVSSDDPAFVRTGDKCLNCHIIFIPNKDKAHLSLSCDHGKYRLFK